MDMRDYRKQWQQLAESWREKDTEVNLSSTKKEKLEEGKKKELPEFIKKKIADAKAKKDGKAPESDTDDNKDKDVEKTNEAVVAVAHAKPVSKKPTVGKKLFKKAVKNIKKVEEDGVSSAGGATTSAGAVAAPVNNTAPNIARYADRLGCKPGQKCDTKPRTRNESAGQRMFSHFSKFLEAEGFQVPAVAPEVTPEISPDMSGVDDLGVDGAEGEDVTADILAALQAKFPGSEINITIKAGEVPFDAQTIEKAQNAVISVPSNDALGEIGGDEDLGMGDTGEEMPIAQEESAMSGMDLIAQEAADYVAGLGGEVTGGLIAKFIQQHHPEALEHLDMIVQAVKVKLDAVNESIALGEEGAEGEETEVGSIDQSVDQNVDGDDTVGVEGGDLEAGAEEPEISSVAITLTPEQWGAFLSSSEGDIEGGLEGGNVEGSEDTPDISPEGGVSTNKEESPVSGEDKSTYFNRLK